MSLVLFKILTPTTADELAAYYHFRWQHLREPWNFPVGSEKDEYEQVSEHRMIVDSQNVIVACGRVHMNTAEEAQIRHIAVHPKYGRKGLGKMMMDALEAVAREHGAVRAVSNSRETSLAFFTSCGFVAEREAPNELGLLKRQQMVKKLSDPQALILHPKWCNQLQQTWHDTIPISEHMGIKLYQYSGRTLETRASLNKNINLHGTMFAGSIFSLATLTGWGMIYLQLKERNLQGDIVLGDADIHYHKPITMKPRALCHIETVQAQYTVLAEGKKCKVTLRVDVLDSDKAVAEFNGVFWIIPDKQ